MTFRVVVPTGPAARNFAEIILTSSITGVSGEYRIPSNVPGIGEGRMVAYYSGPLAAADTFVCNALHNVGSAQNATASLFCYKTGD